MIAVDNEGIPPKEDTTAPTTASIKKSQSNIAINQPSDNPATKSTTSTEPETNSEGMFRTQFQQKTKVLRDAWAQHDFKITIDNWPVFAVILLTVFGIACNVAAISSNRWTCDTDASFGLWDTCYQPITDGPIWAVNQTSDRNESVIAEPLPPVKCAKQGVRWVEVVTAQPSRINQVYAAQCLLVLGCILYAFSLITVCLSYRFTKLNNINAFRNSMIVSVAIQFFSFFCMLVGFYLFILTEQYSISVGLMFIYFGLAMFACNTINFFTVEYKTHKAQKSCVPTCE